MGASTSSSSQRFQQTVDQQVTSKCPRTVCKNEADIGYIEIGGKRNRLSVQQRCTATSDCIINHALKAAAEALAKTKNEAKAGLGIGDASTEQQIETTLKMKVEQDCGSSESRNKLTAKNIKFGTSSVDNTFELMQQGDVKSQCTLSLLSDMINRASGETETKASGFNPLDNPLFLIIAAIVVIVIVVIIVL